MGSLEHMDTHSVQNQWAAWRALPRLLISRQWRWYTLGVIVIAFGLFRLGMWQLERRQQRLERNALVAQRISAPPIELTGQPLDLNEYEYRRVVITGEYDAGQEIVLRNRARGGQPGLDILTPLRIAGSDQSVLVDRGWVPLDQSTPEARRQFAVSGPVRVEGIVRRPQQRSGWIAPTDIQPPGGRLDAWFWTDIAHINTQIPYPLLPFYVEQTPIEGQQGLPSPQLNVDYQSEGSHWSYAIQWFSFMVTGLVGYAALVVQRSRAQS